MITTLFKLTLFLNLFYSVAAIRRNEGYKSFEEEIKCPDGSIGVVEHIQSHTTEPFQAAIYKVDCSSAGGWNITQPLENKDAMLSGLERRQINSCNESCSTQCYSGTGTPLKSDCDAVADYLAGRGQTNTVANGQKIVASSGTCLFRFTNIGYGSVTWCDSNWASRSRAMESQCLPQTPGALCIGSSYMLDVCLDPNAPAQTPSTSSTQVYVAPSASVSSSSNARASSASTANGNSASASSPQSSSGSVSNSGSTSSASSVSGSQSSTASQSSRTASVNISTILAGIPESSSSATVQSAGDENGVPQKQGPSAAAVAGGVVGGLVLLALLLLLIFWRKRSKAQRERTEALSASDENNANLDMEYGGQMVTATSPSSPAMVPGRVLPPAPWYTKTSMTRTQQRPLVLHSGGSATSSAQQLLSQTEDSTGSPDTPITTTSLVPPSTQGLPEFPVAGMQELGRRSMSALTLAHTLAPNLSEGDIRRLADTIVARMQAGVSIPPPELPSSSTAAGSAAADPPPPWRASWNSDTTDPRSRIA